MNKSMDFQPGAPKMTPQTEREISTLQEIVKTYGEEIAVMQEVLKRLDKSLFGNGQPGVIEKLTSRLDKHDRWFWIAIGSLMAFQFLSGSGPLSLHQLLK